MTEDLPARLEAAAAAVRLTGDLVPLVGLILGSGLGALADEAAGALRLPYADIPHLPVSHVPGHAGRLVLGYLAGVPVAIMQGRAHTYEGYSAAETAFGTQLMARLGARALIVTNSAGGLRDDLSPGTLMLIADHINFSGRNPLVGPHHPSLGPRFPDLTAAYSLRLRDEARRVAADFDLALPEGVYCVLGGPSYETPAEIRALARLGADAVGMSTIPEVIAARALGLEVLGISCITNWAAGITAAPLDHADVLRHGQEVAERLRRLVLGVLPAAAEENGGRGSC